jgi:hypothetical protein
MEQDKEANPIAEIFEEVFMLLGDVETRSAVVLEYLKEQGGATEEKLAPYLNRAAAASDVRLRAARARMEHLLAPKPKSTTDTGKDAKTQGKAQSQNKDAQDQAKKDPKDKPEPKDLGKELASAQPGEEKSEGKSDKSKAAGTTNTANSSPDAKSKEKEQEDHKQGEDKASTANSSDVESQAPALGGEKNAIPQKSDTAKKSSDAGNSKSQTVDTDKSQAAKSAK